jgi:hypothetical protein
MKTPIIFISALLASITAMASDAAVLTLRDGQTAKVLSAKGVNTTYLKSATKGSDGKTMLVQDQVFAGEKVAQKSDGTCVLVSTKLLKMDSMSVGDVNVQVPHVETTESVAACRS